MGVKRTDYLIAATDVGYANFDWEKHEQYIEGDTEASFDVIRDGMSGNYCYAGKIIAKADNYDGFCAREVLPIELMVNRAELCERVSKAFNLPSLTPDSFKLILLTHWS